ncbi:MAG: hypothetical protein LBP72_07995, partial [Dysgonamonadaceae bacterium]|nr:hypothetical protein [Dysgonamonadaceae bacterium]
MDLMIRICFNKYNRMDITLYCFPRDITIPSILAVFVAGNVLYVVWIMFFLRYRRKLDMARFAQASAEQSNLVQIVTGMQEIKLNNCERQQRWKWERIQVKLFNISIKGLALGQ